MRLLGFAALSLLASACTAGSPMCTEVACNPAPCCGGPCVTSADCCRGTVCSTEGQCIPDSCAPCGALGCLVNFAACEATCVAPERCGQACGSDAECGLGAHCATLDGERRCVPDYFELECDRCPGGCTFDGASCEVRCTAPSDVDGGALGDAGPPGADTCKACCEPCERDSDCCEGSYCGESAMGGFFCFPVECRTCTYGCTFTCPG